MDLAVRLSPLVDRLAAIDDVQAVAVVGSHSTGRASEVSDIDLFVYLEGSHERILDRRRQLADALAEPSLPIIVSDLVYPHTDVWALRGSNELLDIMFWETAWAESELERRLVLHQANAGYSTAFLRSFFDGVPIYDRDRWLAEFGLLARSPYPEELAQNIIAVNRSFIGREHPFSLRHQIAGGLQKRDDVAVHHRIAAWLASYLDVVFALNRVLHPGEKRQVSFAESECVRLPVAMADDIAVLVGGELHDHRLLNHLDGMLDRLDDLIGADGPTSLEPLEK